MVLDYSMMQWVLSIVVGVSLSRFINTIALIGGKKDQVKLDFLLISILFATTTQMIHVWFNSSMPQLSSLYYRIQVYLKLLQRSI